MDKYKLKFTTLQLEIFKLLCIKTGEKLNQREISRLLDVSPTAIANSLSQLEKEKLIKINKSEKMNLNLIELNREDSKTIKLKKVENLKLLYELRIVDFLEENHPGSTIILFGSYGRGEDTIKSNIDIAIINSKERKLKLQEFEKELEREIRINYYKSLKNINKELRENLCNGIILSGRIEL